MCISIDPILNHSYFPLDLQVPGAYPENQAQAINLILFGKEIGYVFNSKEVAMVHFFHNLINHLISFSSNLLHLSLVADSSADKQGPQHPQRRLFRTSCQSSGIY